MPTDPYARMKRLIDEATRPPKLPKPSYSAFPTEPSFFELSLFEKAVDLISRPVYATASFADAALRGQNPFLAAIKGFAGQSRKVFSDVLGTAGMKPGLARSALGFAGDVLLDPLTYTGVGAVGKAGTLTVKGIPRAMTAAGMATKGAAIDAATIQARRVLSHPRLTPTRLEGLRKGLPTEARVLTEKLAPDAFRGDAGAAALGAKAGRDRTARLMGIETRPGALKGAPAVTPRTQTAMRRHLPPQFKPPIQQGLLPPQQALQAPKAIKFMGQAIPGTEQALTRLRGARPVGKLLDKAEKLPGLGKAVAPTRQLLSKAGGAARALFSAKTGDAEFDYFQTLARDRLHRMNVDTQKYWEQAYKEAEDIIGPDPGRRQVLRREFLKAIEGVEQDFVKLEPHAAEIAVQKRIMEFKRVIAGLGVKEAKINAKAEIARARVEAARQAAKQAEEGGARDRTLIEMEGQEGKIKSEAVQNAVKEAEQELRIMEAPGAGDALSLLDVDGSKIRLTDEFLAKKGSTRGAELRDAIPSKYIAGAKGAGQGPDELASRFNVDTDDEVLDLLVKAGLKRKEVRDRIAKLKGTKKELKAAGATPSSQPGGASTGRGEPPPARPVGAGTETAVPGQAIPIPKDVAVEAPKTGVRSVRDIEVPSEHRAAVEDRVFTEGVAKKKLEAQLEVQKALKAAKNAIGRPEEAAIRQKLAVARDKLAELEKQAASLQPMEVRYRQRVKYKPEDPRIEEWADKFTKRMALIFKQEGKVNPLLKERQFYLPHIMRDEVRGLLINIVKQDPRRILKSSEFSTVTAHAMARSNDKAVLDMGLQKLVEAGDVDPSKVREYMKSIGRPMSAVDELIFESDPVKAGMGRELAHNRAIVAAQLTDDILNSSTFVKARVNADDLLKLRQWRGPARGEIRTPQTNIPLIQKILDEHPDHAIFIPGADYGRAFLKKEVQEAVRQKTEVDPSIQLLKELLGDDLDELPAAMARAEAEGKPIRAYVIPREIADHLSKARKLMLDDGRVHEFLQTFDKWQGWWKAFATVVRPAFHVRNAISNLWQNFLAGVTSPKAYYLAGAIQNEAMRGKLANLGQYSAQQVYDMALELGVLKTGFVGGDIGEFLEHSVRPSGNILSTRGPWAKKMGEVGVTIEDNARLANFIDGLQKGMDPASASMRVKKYLFDYADLSEVEKAVFKRLIPFYTFTRKSIPLAIETLLTQPGKVAILGKARAEAEKGFESLDREYVAEYINKAFGIPVHKNDKGEFEYFLLKGYIPTVDIAKLDHQEILGMLSPFVKTPIEQSLNLDFYRMKPISRFPTEMVQFMGVPMPVRLAHFMRNFVLMAQLDREIFREGAGLGKGIASELSFRVQTQNPLDQMRRYVLSAQVEMGELKRLRDQALERGENYKAAQYDARLSLLTARRDEAKEKAKKIDPDAFKFRKPSTPPKVETPDFNQLRDRMRREMQIDSILKKQKKAAQ